MQATLPRAPTLPSRAGAGAYAGALRRLEARDPGVRFARLRGKRWMYLLAASEEVLAAAAVVEGGWFAGAFAWAVDRATGAVVLDASAAGLPRLQGRVSDASQPGASARFRGHGLSVRIDRDVRGWLVEVEANAGRIEFTLEVERGALPFTLVTPVAGGGLRATEKSGALAAAGAVRLRGRALSLTGGRGGVDVTAGILARETSWRWAFGTGHAGGAPFAFNLCEGFGVAPGDPGEDAAFGGSAPWRLPPVAFRPGASEWRIASEDRSVDLVFTPQAAHRERRNLGVLRTRFDQVAGTFDGVLPSLDGAAIAVVGLPGVVEDHWAVW